MNEISIAAINYFPSLLLMIALMLDMFGYLVRCSLLGNASRINIAISNWVLYTSRIGTMIVLLGMTWFFETNNEIHSIYYGFSIAFFLSGVFGVAYLISSNVRDLFSLCLVPVIYIINRDLRILKLDFDIGGKMPADTLGFVFAVIATSLFIGVALVAPFYLAVLFPDFRMMAAYSNQFLNFAATIIFLTYIDPKMFSALDGAQFHGKQQRGKILPYGELYLKTRVFFNFVFAFVLLCVSGT